MVTMMYGYGAHMGFWQAGLSWFSMIALWGVLVAAVYLLATRRPPARREHWEDVLQTLDQRLASGEIDETEYRRIRDLIGEQHRHQVDTTTAGAR
jgi:uncharacterized membrane protein